jgi:hypothetical protein
MCDPWTIDFTHSSLKYWPKNARVLDVGSLNVNGTTRDICVGKFKEYIGLDMRAGIGVDVVLDAKDILEKYGRESFHVIICVNTLEHVYNWGLAIYNMTMALQRGGIFIVTVPTIGFQRHDYPSDYWRFLLTDLEAILLPMGNILETGSEIGNKCVGIIFRKKADKISKELEQKWLTQLEIMPIHSMDFGLINFEEFDKQEKMKMAINDID